MHAVAWGVVAAFLVPLITAMTLIGGGVAWFVRVQVRLVTEVLRTRLDNVEANQAALARSLADFSKASQDTALTVARIEGKISSGASIATPSA